MRSFTAAVALSALTLVAAQNDTQFTITISDVDETTRSKSQHRISPLFDPLGFVGLTFCEHRPMVHCPGEHLQ